MKSKELKYLPDTLHLTVNHLGRVSLWDGRNSAMSAVNSGEIYIPQTVSSELREDIRTAAEIATDDDEGFNP